jgi:hypothetical protein
VCGRRRLEPGRRRDAPRHVLGIGHDGGADHRDHEQTQHDQKARDGQPAVAEAVESPPGVFPAGRGGARRCLFDQRRHS